MLVELNGEFFTERWQKKLGEIKSTPKSCSRGNRQKNMKQKKVNKTNSGKWPTKN